MSGKEIRPDRVAIYIRWSTEDQGEGTTLAVQMEACRHYLASQGWSVREELIFIDDGYSGGTLERPAMSRLRRLVQAGHVDCVVVFKIDRLSRSVIDTVTLVLQEWEDLTYLKSAREPIDTSTAMGKQFFYMLVSYAEWERNVIRERMFGGKMRRAKEGRCPGFPSPYGYRRGPTAGTLTLVEEEARVVRLVFELAAQGHSVRFITGYLNEKAYRSRTGAHWGTSMVSKMLHNPVYLGRLVWGRTRINPRWKKGPGETRVKQADPYVSMASASIPAIISQEQYDRVQRLMAGKKRVTPGALGSDHLLTGVIRCGKCGRAMQYNASGRWAYYRCSLRAGQALCDAPSVRSQPLEDEVINALRQRYEARAGEQLEALPTGGGEAERLAAAIAATEARLIRLKGQERRINADYRAERLSAGERRQLLADLRDDRVQLLKALAEAQEQQAAYRAGERILAEQVTAIRGRDLFRILPADKQKQIMRCLIREVRAVKAEDGGIDLTVTWKGTA